MTYVCDPQLINIHNALRHLLTSVQLHSLRNALEILVMETWGRAGGKWRRLAAHQRQEEGQQGRRDDEKDQSCGTRAESSFCQKAQEQRPCPPLSPVPRLTTTSSIPLSRNLFVTRIHRCIYMRAPTSLTATLSLNRRSLTSESLVHC